MIKEIRSRIAQGQFEFSQHNETFVERQVTYAIEVDGQFIIVENVPARVCLETGERLFSPETVERLLQTVWEKKKTGPCDRNACA
jgi:YgiT-type zinc finger domain-containing protein